MNDGLSEVLQESSRHTLDECVPLAGGSGQVGNHMTFQQGNIALKVKNKNRPRIGEREVGEGQVVFRVEAGCVSTA